MEKIVDHEISNGLHRYGKKDHTMYRIRSNGYEARDNTWKSVYHLLYSEVLNYCNLMGLDITKNN